MKNLIITLLVLALIVGGWLFFTKDSSDTTTPEDDDTDIATTTTDSTTDTDDMKDKEQSVIGMSAEGRPITAHHFGTGDTELFFIGGIHGGYSWNTARVAQELVEYLKASPDRVPEGVRVTVVPVMNPDGLESVVGTSTGIFTAGDVSSLASVQEAGRFNGNTVDLNRNFDCDWQEDATWQSKSVSGGTAPFSEPESKAVRDYIEQSNPDAVVVWYSAAGGVYASNCHNGVLEETRTLTNLYADASGYPAYEEFDFYEVTGDMVNWLAKENIPAISVLLSTHTDIEWSKNQKGVEALLEYYSKR